MQGIMLGAAIFEMTKLFVYVGTDPALDNFPDLIEKDSMPLHS